MSDTLDMKDPLNAKAMDIMVHFYLCQGFMEAPDWRDLPEDFRIGFRGIAKWYDKNGQEEKDREQAGRRAAELIRSLGGDSA